jgi:hypothetical protein
VNLSFRRSIASFLVASLVLVGLQLGSSSDQSFAATKAMTASTPTISGFYASGQVIEAKPGKWTTGVKFAFQWLREGIPIPRATTKQYRISDEDLGQRLSVKVTGSKSGFKTTAKTSKQTGFIGMINVDQAPKITGDPKVGTPLVADPGIYNPQPKEFTFQWLKDGVDIPLATSNTYTPTDQDYGAAFSVRVTAARAGFQSLVLVSPSTARLLFPSVNNQVPSITYGSLTNGSVLTANPGVWTPADGTYEYQWLKNGVIIPGQTGATYTLLEADKGAYISVAVTVRHPNYSSTTATSGGVGPVRVVRILKGPFYTALSTHQSCGGTGYRTCERDSSGLSGSTQGVRYYSGSYRGDFLLASVAVPWPVSGKRISRWRLIVNGLDGNTFFGIFPGGSSTIFLTGGNGSYREVTWTSSWTTDGLSAGSANFEVGISAWGSAYLASYAIEVEYED